MKQYHGQSKRIRVNTVLTRPADKQAETFKLNQMATTTELPENVIIAYECAGYENRDLSQAEIIKMLSMHGYKDADTVSEALETVNDLFTMLAFLGY